MAASSTPTGNVRPCEARYPSGVGPGFCPIAVATEAICTPGWASTPADSRGSSAWQCGTPGRPDREHRRGAQVVVPGHRSPAQHRCRERRDRVADLELWPGRAVDRDVTGRGRARPPRSSSPPLKAIAPITTDDGERRHTTISICRRWRLRRSASRRRSALEPCWAALDLVAFVIVRTSGWRSHMFGGGPTPVRRPEDPAPMGRLALRSRDDRDGFDRIPELEPQDLRVERQLGLVRLADRLRLAEPVLFALEQQVGMREPLGGEGLDHHLGLGRGNDLVLVPLQQDHRARDHVDEVDRRAGPVEIERVGEGPHQGVLVARLELVRVTRRERLQVGDPEVAGARREVVVERQRAERRVAAGAPAPDQQPVAVGLARARRGTGRR